MFFKKRKVKEAEKPELLEGSVEYNDNLNAPDESEDIEVYYGPIEEGKLRYIWLSEPGACKECQKLDGKIYDSANDIPPKPHPNCKCHVEPIKSKTPTKDPIKQRREKALEQEKTQLELDKLKGDVSAMQEEAELCEVRIDEELDFIKLIISVNKIYESAGLDFDALKKYNFDVEISKNDVQQIKQEIKSLNSDIVSLRTLNNYNEKNKIQQRFKNVAQKLYKLIDNIIYRNNIISKLRKPIMTAGINGKGLQEYDAAQLWNIALLDDFNDSYYVQKNGFVIEDITEIADSNLQNHIFKKVEKQLGSTDKKGIWFHEKSSLAKAYSNSTDFKSYIRNIKPQLIKNKTCPDGSIEFKKINDKNLYHAIHMSDILDIKLDKHQNLHAKIFDTYDFNDEGYISLVGQARILQEHHDIETYYTITDIMIPRDEWMNY